MANALAARWAGRWGWSGDGKNCVHAGLVSRHPWRSTPPASPTARPSTGSGGRQPRKKNKKRGQSPFAARKDSDPFFVTPFSTSFFFFPTIRRPWVGATTGPHGPVRGWGGVGSRERSSAWMRMASLHGWIHGDSREPTPPRQTHSPTPSAVAVAVAVASKKQGAGAQPRQPKPLTAIRKCPPHPCRCRCTSSPCRTSAGDDAGRAAGSRYGSHRSRPAGGPARSPRPAG